MRVPKRASPATRIRTAWGSGCVSYAFPHRLGWIFELNAECYVIYLTIDCVRTPSQAWPFCTFAPMAASAHGLEADLECFSLGVASHRCTAPTCRRVARHKKSDHMIRTNTSVHGQLCDFREIAGIPRSPPCRLKGFRDRLLYGLFKRASQRPTDSLQCLGGQLVSRYTPFGISQEDARG